MIWNDKRYNAIEYNIILMIDNTSIISKHFNANYVTDLTLDYSHVFLDYDIKFCIIFLQQLQKILEFILFIQPKNVCNVTEKGFAKENYEMILGKSN